MRRLFFALAFVSLAPLAVSAAVAERRSDLADQRAVSLTIYNNDLALVHDRRRVTLTAGENRLALRDVSARIDATSALFRDVDAPGAVDVQEQNFDYDLLNPQRMLEKYVGRRVTIVHTNPRTGVETREPAEVLSANNGIVLRYADRIETQLDGRIVYPAIPGDLRDHPTLVLTLDARSGGARDVELAYLTGGLAWHADYVGQMNADETTLDLTGLVTLQNESGTTYRNARLQLVAGNVNIVRRAFQPQQTADMYQVKTIGTVRAQPSEESLADFHLYTMPHVTTIADKETKQVALLDASAIPVRRTLELRGNPYYYSNAAADLGARLPVDSYLSFTNKGGDLGIPLPAGIVRIYKNDKGGTSQFVGSDTIAHTPKNEDVRLKLGTSFDVTASKKQTTFARRTAHAPHTSAYASGYEIRLRNARSTPVDVLVVEPIPGDWTIESESAPHTKSSAGTATWHLIVPAEGETTLRYEALAEY